MMTRWLVGLFSPVGRQGSRTALLPRRCYRSFTDNAAPSAAAAVHGIAATGFALGADSYEATRPSYPSAALTRAMEVGKLDGPERKRVLDVAAGTGKFTRLLAEYSNLEVTALEPVANMRKAFHWFDNMESVREIHRVLKPGGALILIWNMEDRKAPWVAELRDAYEPYDESAPQYRKGHWKRVFNDDHLDKPRLFTPLQTTFVPHTMHVTKQEVWSRVLSKSYVASLPASEQSKLRLTVESILDRHDKEFQQQHQEEERVALQPLLTEVTWTYAI